MTDNVSADPNEIESFARELQKYNTDLDKQTKQIKAKLRRLNETWKDNEFQKFANEFERTIRVIDQFNEVSKQQVPLLRKKAEFLYGFLGRR